jgi:hypothetical protein
MAGKWSAVPGNGYAGPRIDEAGSLVIMVSVTFGRGEHHHAIFSTGSSPKRITTIAKQCAACHIRVVEKEERRCGLVLDCGWPSSEADSVPVIVGGLALFCWPIAPQFRVGRTG